MRNSIAWITAACAAVTCVLYLNATITFYAYNDSTNRELHNLEVVLFGDGPLPEAWPTSFPGRLIACRLRVQQGIEHRQFPVETVKAGQ